MSRVVTIAFSMIAGAALGAATVGGLHAQGKPGAFAVVDISAITDENTYRQQLLPKVTPASLAPFGGQYVARTENITAIDGTPPKRFVIIAFDNMDKAKAWDSSPNQKEVNALRAKATRSRAFFVDGALQ
jgi:uncharacterized protein (DUF1330 family)